MPLSTHPKQGKWLTAIIQLAALASVLTCSPTSYAATTRLTKITLVRKGDTSSFSVRMYGPLQIEADTSQAGKAPGTTTLIGHVAITAKRRGRPSLHLHANKAIIETDLMEIQVLPLHHGDDPENHMHG